MQQKQSHGDRARNMVQGLLSQKQRFYANLAAFVSRLFALSCKPKHFAPLVLDYWLLVQSLWSRRQPGPDLVYPMSSIGKRQSGRLARLILEHCRDVSRYEFHASTPFPMGIDPPSVAVVDLDEVSQVVENGYSTQVDLYGLMCIPTLIETVVSLFAHVFYTRDKGWIAWFNWTQYSVVILIFCLYAGLRGDGTLTLARRSDASTPGCAVLLSQDFTLVLHGNQSVVEAIGESTFNLSHLSAAWRPHVRRDRFTSYLSYRALEALCEGLCAAVLAGCWFLFQPSSTLRLVPIIFPSLMSGLAMVDHPESSEFEEAFSIGTGFFRFLPTAIFIGGWEQLMMGDPAFAFEGRKNVHLLSLVPFIILCASYRSRDYPLRITRFLDALGHPPVRKWEFDTLAAAATFQCLVICRDIPRPIQTIDVPALLDMLVPDQRDVWMAWKGRVADRIVHEEDISFAPTIPSFGDQRQGRLKNLLDEAQFAYDTYVRVCEQRGKLVNITRTNV